MDCEWIRVNLCVEDTIQQRYNLPGAITSKLSAVPCDEHILAIIILNVSVRKQAYGRGPDEMVGVYVRELDASKEVVFGLL